MYDLVYFINNKKIETVMYNRPISLCKWKKIVLSLTTHKTGTFKFIEHESRKE